MRKKKLKIRLHAIEMEAWLKGLQIRTLVAQADERQELLAQANQKCDSLECVIELGDKEIMELRCDVIAAEQHFEEQLGKVISLNADVIRLNIELNEVTEIADDRADEIRLQRNTINELFDKILALEGANLRPKYPICKSLVGLNCLNMEQCNPGSCDRDKQVELEDKAMAPQWCPTGGMKCKFPLSPCNHGECDQDNMPF